MTITNFLNNNGFFEFEGYCIPKQIEDLKILTSTPNINIMEIGFNAGHSAEAFLENNKELKLTSFDLGDHDYCLKAKEYIDNTYPNRHTLILGDSKITVPKYINDNKNTKFDIIFIDGGHDYITARDDLLNCFNLAHKNTIVILDDVIFKKEFEIFYTIGPTQVWTENLLNTKIFELNRVQYEVGRGMVWGKYIFD
jgi:hypothetical protein